MPILPGEKAVSVHNLRGVYAQICTYFFCPPDRTTARFLQECLGHVISEAELKRSNSSATQYYFHYYLVDDLGGHLSAKGVKLGVNDSNDSIEPLFIPAEPAESVVQNDLLYALQEEVRRLWAQVNQTTVPVVDLSGDLANVLERVSSLEKDLKDAHRRIDQLLMIVQPDIPRNSKRHTPAATKILMAIDLIMEWNSSYDPKFAVSQTLLLKATGCNRPAIQRVLVDLAEEIDRHHAQFSISRRGQARDLNSILEWLKSRVVDI